MSAVLQDSSSATYGGFWKRLAAHFIDLLILLPFNMLLGWLCFQNKDFAFYSHLPSSLVPLWYSVFLVVRFGATPGKLIMGLKIIKLDLQPIGYQEAILRVSVIWILGFIMGIGTIYAIDAMSELDFRTLGFLEKAAHLDKLMPGWAKFTSYLLTIWTWSEFLVMLTNKKRRGTHDFLAGTVVVDKKSLSASTAVQSPVSPVNSPV